ncbi:cobalamin-dependent protein [Ferrovibrio sp.]|uniref:cobalamin-dependent protein n=1 Tax=Ferrovibrio sp. TaxID=1917215 RepID=UPI0025C2EB86|nr:cobalamin-dependent protein [Ferrovibrio sp.]MBX3452922.1 cobalamin-dependent protein [Ferrovibrio sp.]
MQEKPIIRILLAKPGLCTHETGVKLLAAGLRDSGMEVIYTGVFQEKDNIARVALQEDVDVVGLSYLNGGHVALTKGVIGALQEVGRGDIPVIVGGIIPKADIEPLHAIGVAGVYGPGTAIPDIAEDIRRIVREASAAPALAP